VQELRSLASNSVTTAGDLTSQSRHTQIAIVFNGVHLKGNYRGIKIAMHTTVVWYSYRIWQKVPETPKLLVMFAFVF